jgi:hypothetical protein
MSERSVMRESSKKRGNRVPEYGIVPGEKWGRSDNENEYESETNI